MRGTGELTRRPLVRRPRDQYGDPSPEREPLTALERILVGTVVLALGCFEAWFLFFAGSPLPPG